jgi:multisubunit Na+/H+ antiporter MnhG subunit
LAALWWGSGRRLRRFLYGGMVGVILATLGQLIHSLQSVLQWILVSVVVGLALFLLGAFVERNLGRLKASLQEALETWE